MKLFLLHERVNVSSVELSLIAEAVKPFGFAQAAVCCCLAA